MPPGFYNTSNPDTNFDRIDCAVVDKKTILQSAMTRRLYDWWLSFAPCLPERKSFDIVEHIKYASHVFMYESIDEYNFEYRVVGEDVKRIVGAKLPKDRNLLAVGDPQSYVLLRYLQQVRDTWRCHCCTGMVNLLPKRRVSFESIDCPVLGPEGDVRFIIGVIEQFDG